MVKTLPEPVLKDLYRSVEQGTAEKLPLANTMGNSYNNTIENVDQE